MPGQPRSSIAVWAISAAGTSLVPRSAIAQDMMCRSSEPGAMPSRIASARWMSRWVASRPVCRSPRIGVTLEARAPMAAIEEVKAIASAGEPALGAAGAGARRASGLADGAAAGVPKRPASGCASLRPKSFGIFISGGPAAASRRNSRGRCR